MKTSEVRKVISESPSSDWFNNLVVPVEYKNTNFKQEFKGFSSYYKFIEEQVDGWDELSANLPAVLNGSRQHFITIKNSIHGFIESRSNNDENHLENWWNQSKRTFEVPPNDVFTYDSPETKFIISVHNTQTESVAGAFAFLIGRPNYNNHENLVGTLLAYEFRRSEYPKLKYRKLGESESFKGMIASFKKQVSDGENQLTEHLTNAAKKYEDYSSKVDAFKVQKEELFTEWFDESQNKSETFFGDSEKKITDLEETYKHKLQLEEPAKYWGNLSTAHKKQGWWAFGVLVVFVVLVVVLLGILLWKPPSEIFVSFFEEDKSAAIRWSIPVVHLGNNDFQVVDIIPITFVNPLNHS